MFGCIRLGRWQQRAKPVVSGRSSPGLRHIRKYPLPCRYPLPLFRGTQHARDVARHRRLLRQDGQAGALRIRAAHMPRVTCGKNVAHALVPTPSRLRRSSAAARRTDMVREHLAECDRRVCLGFVMRAKLLANFQATAPMPRKQPSRPQLRDAGIERPFAGVVNEIVGLDGVEFRPALPAHQEVLFKCGRSGGREAPQRIVLDILGRLVVVDTFLGARHRYKIVG